MERLTYTLHETADVLGVSYRTVRRYAANGELPTLRIGRRVLVSRRVVEAWLAPRDLARLEV
jgi:excisionase family DNA binding protein